MAERFRVDKKDLEFAARQERERHPWMGIKTSRRIARENLQRHPKFYVVEGQAEYLRANAERGMKPQKRRRKKPRQDGPFGGLPPHFHDVPF